MKTIVPAKKRVNPWAVARIVGMALLIATPLALTAWAWWHIFTADMSPFTFVNLAAVEIAFFSSLAVIVGAVLTVAVAWDCRDDLARWWNERESAWGEVEDR